MQQEAIHPEQEASNWGAVFSLFLGVTALICAEFLPISLLTPIAEDLNISKGTASGSVAAVGILAVITSLLLAPLTRNINRRTIMLLFSVLLVVANLIVGYANSYWLLLIGRGLLGICVGGFWSLCSAVVLQLVPKHEASKALGLVYAGVSVATLLSIPLSYYFGAMIGWRNVFLCAAGLGAVALVVQYYTLPSLMPQATSSFRVLVGLLKKNWVLMGIAGMIFSFGGYYVFFTFLRPFMEQNLALSANNVTLALALFAFGSCLSTFCAGYLLKYAFRTTLAGSHIALAIVSLMLFFGSDIQSLSYVLVLLWGFVFGIIPVAWSTWVVRTLADKAEIAGGLTVAAIQFSVAVGAAIGGFSYDHIGFSGNFILAFLLILIAIFTVFIGFRMFYRDTGQHV